MQSQPASTVGCRFQEWALCEDISVRDTQPSSKRRRARLLAQPPSPYSSLDSAPFNEFSKFLKSPKTLKKPSKSTLDQLNLLNLPGVSLASLALIHILVIHFAIFKWFGLGVARNLNESTPRLNSSRPAAVQTALSEAFQNTCFKALNFSKRCPPMLTLHPSFLLFCLQALHQNLENLKPKMRGSKIEEKVPVPNKFTLCRLAACCSNFGGRLTQDLDWNRLKGLFVLLATRSCESQIWLPVCEKNAATGPKNGS